MAISESVQRSSTWRPSGRIDLLRAVVGPSSWFQLLVVAVAGLLLGGLAFGVTILPMQFAPLALIALIAPVIGIIVGQLRRLLLAGIALDISLGLEINFGYRMDAGAVGALGGWSVSITTIFLIMLYALWLAEALASNGQLSIPRLRASKILLLYCAVVGISVIVAYDSTLALFQVFFVAQMLALFVYIASTVRERNDVAFLLSMLAIGVVLQGLIMIGVYLTGQHLEFASISTQMHPSFANSGRVGGTLGSPNTAAGYLVLSLAPMIALANGRLDRMYSLLGTVALGLGAIGLILTGSRAGLLAFAVTIGIVGITAWRRGWISFRVPLLVFGLLVAGILIFGGPLLRRFLLDDGGAAYSRVPLMRLAWNVVKDHPVLGVGANNFGEVLPFYATPEFGGEWLYIVHNQYLLVWAETGTIGFLLFIGFLITTVVLGWRAAKTNDRFLALAALGLTAAIIGNMLHMFVDVFNSRPLMQALWLSAGLTFALHAIRQTEMMQSQQTDGHRQNSDGYYSSNSEANHQPSWPLQVGSVMKSERRPW